MKWGPDSNKKGKVCFKLSSQGCGWYGYGRYVTRRKKIVVKKLLVLKDFPVFIPLIQLLELTVQTQQGVIEILRSHFVEKSVEWWKQAIKM